MATSGETDDTVSVGSDSIVDMPFLRQGFSAFLEKQCARVLEEAKAHMPSVIKRILCSSARDKMATHKQALQQVWSVLVQKSKSC